MDGETERIDRSTKILRTIHRILRNRGRKEKEKIAGCKINNSVGFANRKSDRLERLCFAFLTTVIFPFVRKIYKFFQNSKDFVSYSYQKFYKIRDFYIVFQLNKIIALHFTSIFKLLNLFDFI